MADKHEVELWVAMNESAEYICTTDESEALSKLAEDMGGWVARVVKITLQMTAPEIAQMTGDVPDEAGTIGQLKAE